MKNPTALDRVSVRRLLMYINKKLNSYYRDRLAGNIDDDVLQTMAEAELYWLNESNAIYDYEVAVNEHSAVVGIQPKQGWNWIYIELEARKECQTILE